MAPPQRGDDDDDVSETFRRDGILVVEGVLEGAALESFRAQVSRELTRPCIPPESGTPTGVSLEQSHSWPRGSARRVIEVVPPGIGPHWDALTASLDHDSKPNPLVSTLNALLGEGAWELPTNQPHGGACEVRHWYCPVVFPEANGGGGGERIRTAARGNDNWRRGDVGKDAAAWTREEEEDLHRLRVTEGLPWWGDASVSAVPSQPSSQHHPGGEVKKTPCVVQVCHTRVTQCHPHWLS